MATIKATAPRADFLAALSALVDAAMIVDRTFPGEATGYPAGLPDFTEHLHALIEWRDAERAVENPAESLSELVRACNAVARTGGNRNGPTTDPKNPDHAQLVRWLRWNDPNGDYWEAQDHHEDLSTIPHDVIEESIAEAWSDPSELAFNLALPEAY